MSEGSIREKEAALRAYIRGLGSLAVAFSAGVDSTFLLKVAHEELGDRCLAVTGRSPAFPAGEREEAGEFCRAEGIRQVFFDTNELGHEIYASNPKDRCYHCKKIIFSKIKAIAAENGITHVAEGSNVDDLGDYRPGLLAIDELKILSPLREAGLTKAEIRSLSKEMGLPTWDKPSAACLASRIPYGERITAEKLAMAGGGEALLHEMGFRQCRVRVHGQVARIEVPAEEITRLAAPEVRDVLVPAFRKLGFLYVTCDLQGYRMGSLNEAIGK